MNKTKVITFTYTKDNGEVSNRMGITLGYSSPKLALIADITDFAPEDVLELFDELSDLRREYLENISNVLKEYDVSQKTFKLSGITDEKEISLRNG